MGSEPRSPSSSPTFSPPDWWPEMRDAMSLISAAIWASGRAGEESAAIERRLLRQVGNHPTFNKLAIKAAPLERGKWIAGRVSAASARLVTDFVADGVRADREPGDKATYLWGLALSAGLTVDELCSPGAEIFSPRNPAAHFGRDAIKSRIRGAMWLSGNHPLQSAKPGIDLVRSVVISSLQGRSAQEQWMQSATFDYEWQRLERFPAERQLLTIVAFFAALQPVPFDLLDNAWEALPTKLRREVREHGSVGGVATSLDTRELVAVKGQALIISERTRNQVLEKLDPKAKERGTFEALRILKAGLPADTHHHTTWSAWRTSMPHVDTATERSAKNGVGHEYAAHLLDRASVFLRQGNGEATRASQYAARAVSLAEEHGRPDAAQFAIYLSNHAMALSHLHKYDLAISQMDRSLDVTKATVGAVTEEFAGSLNVKANMLKHAGETRKAEEAHALSLETIRSVLGVNPTEEAQGTLVEILNDYAADLLQASPSPVRANLAMELLKEADVMLTKGDYGWSQIQLNLADALRQTGDLQGASVTLRKLERYTETAYGPVTLERFAALHALAEVLKELDDPQYDEVYLLAHEIDDQLGPYGEHSGDA